MSTTKSHRFDPQTGPKRILSLDGGGIRGVLTLEYLSIIEDLLRKRSKRADLRLCDYFDLIGGTSTGAILAAALACGASVAELKQLYRQLGTYVFEPSFFRRGYLATKFPVAPLQKALEDTLGADTTLDSDKVRTGLMIMVKRLDTGSLWPLHNNPHATYAAQDGQLRLAEVVRASTAAPTYFDPERITISSRAGRKIDGAFVDGGVSPFNDPSLQLLMVAALQGHGFRWKTGPEKLLLISIGTGTRHELHTTEQITDWTPLQQGLCSLASLMDDCAHVSLALLQWLTRCLTPWIIDRAVGDMSLDSGNGPQLATYARYNALLDNEWLKTQLKVDYSASRLAQIARMDDPSNMQDLAIIGRAAALQQIRDEHFPASFDLA